MIYLPSVTVYPAGPLWYKWCCSKPRLPMHCGRFAEHWKWLFWQIA